MVILDEEPLHRSDKEFAEQESQIKKSRKHIKDQYEREENDSDSDGYLASQENIPNQYQPSTKRSKSYTMKDPEENSKIRDSPSTNETNFKRLEHRIEEVALGQNNPTLKIRDTISAFTARVLEHPPADHFRMPSIPTYDGKMNPGDHLNTFTSRMLLQGAGPKIMCNAFSITLAASTKR